MQNKYEKYDTETLKDLIRSLITEGNSVEANTAIDELSRRRKGRPRKGERNRVHVTARIDADHYDALILEHGDFQSFLNAATAYFYSKTKKAE